MWSRKPRRKDQREAKATGCNGRQHTWSRKPSHKDQREGRYHSKACAIRANTLGWDHIEDVQSHLVCSGWWKHASQIVETSEGIVTWVLYPLHPSEGIVELLGKLGAVDALEHPADLEEGDEPASMARNEHKVSLWFSWLRFAPKDPYCLSFGQIPRGLSKSWRRCRRREMCIIMRGGRQ